MEAITQTFRDPTPLVGDEMSLPAEARRLLAHWRAHAVDGFAPRTAFSPHHLRDWLGNICVVAREVNPVAHRMRLVGSFVTPFIGQHRSGKLLEEYVPAEAQSAVIDPYLESAEANAPVFSRMTPSFAVQSDFRWIDRLILPVASDRAGVERFFYVWVMVDGWDKIRRRTIYDGWEKRADRPPVEARIVLP